MNASGRIQDEVIGRHLDLDAYATDEVRTVLEILERAHASILGKMAATRGEGTRSWLRDVLAEVDIQYRQVKHELDARLDAVLPEVARDESAAALDDLRSAGISVSLAGPSMDTLLSSLRSLPADAGSTLGELYAKYEAGAIARMTASIRQGFVEGETLDQLVRRIRGRTVVSARKVLVDGTLKRRKPVFEGGVIDVTTRNAEVLVRTTISHIANVARAATYAANNDIVRAVQWVATLDPTTCPQCGEKDGKTWPLGEPHPTPPAHPKCRCVMTPVLKSWREMGIDKDELDEATRASMDGQVPASTSFEDWLRRQSDKVQARVLGKTKAELFRKGVTLGKLNSIPKQPREKKPKK